MAKICVELDQARLTVFIVGRFDYDIVDDFRDSYTSLFDSDVNISLDLSQTDHIDSSALGMILNMKSHLKKEDQAIEIKNCKPNLMKLFSMAHFERKFKFV
ncbi:MAG: STAS domain-containing protein [Bermanella sp.]